MKRFFVICLCSFVLTGLYAQHHQSELFTFPEAYVDITVQSPKQLQQLAYRFSVDKVLKNNGVYQVRLWLGPHDYQDFLDFGISYELSPRSAKYGELSMATTYEQMASWNKYPTYSVYCAMMDTFQRRFPTLCRVDTILAVTPNDHSLLACYVGSNVDGSEQRPQFFYTSTMHGDEQTGFVMMLRLIDYLLNNYTTDSQVQHIVDNVDLWICPVENPDGMYARSDNSMGGGSYWNPGSTRANANGVDLNRHYPEVGQPAKSYEPEIQAMIDFASSHHFVMSANFHGGTELYNFPWDYWTSDQVTHADESWWWLVGNSFADTCHKYGPTGYFMGDYDSDGPVTPGGDWYTVDGSRQDYMNYYQHCREVTIEISEDKSPSSSQLPQFWTSLKHSLLNYVEECLNGFNGTVTDSITGAPLEAEVFIQNHDINFSEVYSYLPEGKYYRPIKSGAYTVTFSAEGYVSKTIQVTTVDGSAQQVDVQLVPEGYVPGGEAVSAIMQQQLLIYPDPVGNVMHIRADEQWQTSDAVMYDATGRQVLSFKMTGEITAVDVSKLAKGTYFVHFRNTATGDSKTITVVRN
ncbi:MAG: T9SS type A sorting domain-containing protein [Bacteroidales bacterium]|nr:T9SS type A sorting domain-containing protein [Bacteroidales bacterium]